MHCSPHSIGSLHTRVSLQPGEKDSEPRGAQGWGGVAQGYLAGGGGLAADTASAGHTAPQPLAGGGGVVTDAGHVEPAATVHTAHTLTEGRRW